MLAGWFGRGKDAEIVDLYRRLVQLARTPAFYSQAGVPDSVEGRLEVLMLHVGLAVRALGARGAAGRGLAGRLGDCFFDDMEVVLREHGISDTGLAKRLKALAESFYGRLASYDAALAAADRAGLTSAIARNLLGGAAGQAAALADHAVRLAEALARLSPQRLAADLDSLPVFAPATPPSC